MSSTSSISNILEISEPVLSIMAIKVYQSSKSKMDKNTVISAQNLMHLVCIVCENVEKENLTSAESRALAIEVIDVLLHELCHDTTLYVEYTLLAHASIDVIVALSKNHYAINMTKNIKSHCWPC
jgi:hypothetical protein